MSGVPSSLGRGATLEKEVLFALRHHRELIVELTLGVVGCGFANALLALSAGAVAEALGRTPFDHPVVPGGSFGPSIEGASYVGLCAAIVKAGLGSLLSASETRLGAIVSGGIRMRLVSRFLLAGTGMPAPAALALIAVRLRETEGSIVHGVIGRARGVAQLAPLALCLLLLSPKLALGAALVVAPFAVVLSRFRRGFRGATERAQTTVQALEAGVDELVRNVDLFRAYGAGERACAVIDHSTSESTREAARLGGTRALLSGFNEVMAALAVVGVVALAGRLGLSIGGSGLVPFAAVFFMAYRPLRDLGDAKSWLERGSVALDAIGTLSANEGPGFERYVAPKESNVIAASDGIEKGPPEVVALEFGGAEHGAPATFRARPGQVIAVVGPTGSGKTTLFRAMLGLTRARGRLLVDDRDVTGEATGPARRPFGWVPQEAPLVTGTVVDNVAIFGGKERAIAALRLVGAERLAEPNEIVGPGGRPLSGGERRLLSLARALASNLPVLLLDEPTEGLDANATRRVLDAIVRLRGQRTIVVATHRDEVVAVADLVVHLGEGQRRAAAE